MKELAETWKGCPKDTRVGFSHMVISFDLLDLIREGTSTQILCVGSKYSKT